MSALVRGGRALLAIALAIALTVWLGLAARVAHAGVDLPVVVDRGPIHVRAAAGLEREARRLAERAERDLERIAADLEGLPRPATVEIRLVVDTDELSGVSPPGRGAPRWAAGVAFPDVGVLALAIRRGGQLHDLDKTLAHELAHLALGAAVPTAPRWLHEGFAWQQARDFDLDRLQALAGMAWFGGVLPLDELEAGFPAAEAPASRAYAESYDFVGFLVERGRYPDADDDGDRWPFRRYLRALAGGATLDDAALEAYGATMDELFVEWKSSLVRRYLLVPASVFTSALWVIASCLLVLGWWRRRRRSKAQLATWEAEEEAAEARRRAVVSSWVVAPPPTAIDRAVLDAHGRTGDDGDGDGSEAPDPADDLDDDRRPPPRWIN
jgi:hypothetical protein